MLFISGLVGVGVALVSGRLSTSRPDSA
jgi:hypothetical protein